MKVITLKYNLKFKTQLNHKEHWPKKKRVIINKKNEVTENVYLK